MSDKNDIVPYPESKDLTPVSSKHLQPVKLTFENLEFEVNVVLNKQDA
jgi:hypothetical protein